jgi:hypothetical protein
MLISLDYVQSSNQPVDMYQPTIIKTPQNH